MAERKRVRTRRPIVIVEDDDGMRQAIGRLLKAAGYTTAAFESAEVMLRTCAAEAACLVLDVRLPGISGFDLQKRIADAGANLPVIFITAHDDPLTRKAAARAGAVACLRKPFARKELLEAIARAVPEGTGRSNDN